MRYIGGKTELLCHIHDAIKECNACSVIDIFAGSGAVSSFLSKNGFRIVSNDLLYFSFVLNRGVLNINESLTFDKKKVKEAIDKLNSLTLRSSGIDLKDCFIRNNYSPHEECSRMYFQEKNALKIDLIRITIERWYQNKELTEDEYFYLLSRLLYSVPSVSNIAGVYGAFLKTWDPRAFKDLKIELSDNLSIGKPENVVLNKSFTEVLETIEADALYADPPYNSRQYLPNYHILETIARYDYPEIHGITGMRNYEAKEKSDFCSKSKVAEAFCSLIENAKVRSIVISYSNEGLLPEAELDAICQSYALKGSFNKREIPYRRFKSHGTGKDHVKELLISFDK